MNFVIMTLSTIFITISENIFLQIYLLSTVLGLFYIGYAFYNSVKHPSKDDILLPYIAIIMVIPLLNTILLLLFAVFTVIDLITDYSDRRTASKISKKEMMEEYSIHKLSAEEMFGKRIISFNGVSNGSKLGYGCVFEDGTKTVLELDVLNAFIEGEDEMERQHRQRVEELLGQTW